jgi:hypothetical protein
MIGGQLGRRELITVTAEGERVKLLYSGQTASWASYIKDVV